MRQNPNSIKPSQKARNKPPKDHTKYRPFVLCKISKDGVFRILYSRLESPEQVGFNYDGSALIFYNYANSHIFPEEDMFTDNIQPIIYNGFATISGKDMIPKGIGIVIWYYTDDRGQLHIKILNNVL